MQCPMCRRPIDKDKTTKKVLEQRAPDQPDDPWGLGGGKGDNDVVVGPALAVQPSLNAIDSMFGSGNPNAVAPNQ